MPKTSLYNMEGAAIGEVELSEELFAAPINTAAMHLVCLLYTSLVAHVKGFAVVALALAHVARHVDVGHEMHLDLEQAVAAAGLRCV